MTEHPPLAWKPGLAGVVYGLLADGGPVRYVGSTKQHPAVRIAQGLGSYAPPVSEWARGLGDRLRFVVLEEVTEGGDLLAAEQRWYEMLRECGLLNTTPPRTDTHQSGPGRYRSKRRGRVS